MVKVKAREPNGIEHQACKGCYHCAHRVNCVIIVIQKKKNAADANTDVTQERNEIF